MNARFALVAGLVSLLATAAGCARPDVVSLATSARAVPAYRGQLIGPTGLESARPFDVAAAPWLQPAALPTATRDRAPTAAIRAAALVQLSQPRATMLAPALDGAVRDHRR